MLISKFKSYVESLNEKGKNQEQNKTKKKRNCIRKT